MDAVALAAALGGSAVGLGGIVFSGLNARGERAHAATLAREQHDHERALARQSRLSDEVRNVYIELIEYVLLIDDVVQCTHPIVGPKPAPPPLPPENETRAMVARAKVLGSQEVDEAVERVAAASRSFFARAHILDAVAEGRAEDRGEAWKDVHEARERFGDEVRKLHQIIRSEAREEAD